MKLPSLNQFRNAYKKTKTKFCKCDYYKKGACCPIGVLALSKGVTNKKMGLEKRARKAFEYSNNFEGAGDFIRGVDGSGMFFCNNLDAYKHGVLVRETLEKEFS